MITCVLDYVIDPARIDAADRIGDESGCVLRYDRSFMRPLLPRWAGPTASP